MKKLNKALKSRTVLFSILLAALSAIQGFVLAINIDPAEQALIGFAISIGIILLRAITTKPLFE